MRRRRKRRRRIEYSRADGMGFLLAAAGETGRAVGFCGEVGKGTVTGNGEAALLSCARGLLLFLSAVSTSLPFSFLGGCTSASSPVCVGGGGLGRGAGGSS